MEEAILKRLYTIRFQLYDTLGKENYGDSKKAMVTRGWREELQIGRVQRIFRTGRLLLCMIYIIYNRMHVVKHVFKFMECTTPRGNPNINYGFSVTGICHCRFISYNRYTSLLRDADNGRDCVCAGVRGYMRNLCIIPSTLL